MSLTRKSPRTNAAIIARSTIIAATKPTTQTQPSMAVTVRLDPLAPHLIHHITAIATAGQSQMLQALLPLLEVERTQLHP